MFQKYFLIFLSAVILAFVLYLFGPFFISSNRNYSQGKVVTEVENQEGIPGGHFKLKTHDGKIFNTLENEDPMLIYFGFTYCPDVCPITLLTMANVLDKLENEKIIPLFITVDPERDNETILSNYVSAFHDDIIGLTGSIDEINKSLGQVAEGFWHRGEDQKDERYQRLHRRRCNPSPDNNCEPPYPNSSEFMNFKNLS